MNVEISEEEYLAEADKALSELLDKYNVDLCAEFECEFWLEMREPARPILKIVC